MQPTKEATFNILLQQNKLIRNYWYLEKSTQTWQKVDLLHVSSTETDQLIGKFTVGAKASLSIPIQLDPVVKNCFVAADDAATMTFGNVMYPRNPAFQEGSEDLSQLSYLNEPEVLNSLLVRYGKFSIYTYCGIVLVAINPYTDLPQLYSDQVMSLYWGKERQQVEPHLFVVAEEAYRQLVRTSKSQSIIISGESGAGKTVSAKYIIKFLTSKEPQLPYLHGTKHFSGNNSGAAGNRAVSPAVAVAIENKIIATNPILEAFGNAQTVRNDNSSRFGKFLQIIFSSSSNEPRHLVGNVNLSIMGAKIQTFLLEKSRVTHQAEGEGNFHIFYLMQCHQSFREKYQLTGQFRFLPKTQCIELKVELEEVLDGFEMFGIGPDDASRLFCCLAAILHLGNISIEGNEDESHISSTDRHLQIASELLEVDSSVLSTLLTKKLISTNVDRIAAHQSIKQATASRDSLCRTIYELIFTWIVSILNSQLSPIQSEPDFLHISVLDIYGFETFKRNGFEQFCINYANEKLQQEFVRHAFQLEQELFVQEGLEWPALSYRNNDACIDVIEGTMGIIDALDDCCKLSNGTDRMFVQRIARIDKNDCVSHSITSPNPDSFCIHHYAASIEYDGRGFCEKNRDEVISFSTEMATVGKLQFFTQALGIEVGKGNGGSNGSGRKKESLVLRFKSSLTALMQTLYSTDTHYIRCIKPNQSKRSFAPDPVYTQNQLRACGILESTRIYSQGYPTKIPVDEFITRYKILSPLIKDTNIFVHQVIQQSLQKQTTDCCCTDCATSESLYCSACKNSSVFDSYLVGKSKVFLRSGIVARLESEKERVFFSALILIQSLIRTSCYSHLFTTLSHHTSLTQSCFYSRQLWIKRLEEKFLKASQVLYKFCKQSTCRLIYLSFKHSAALIIRNVRRSFVHAAIRIHKITIVQIRILRYLQMQHKSHLLSSIHLIQSFARSVLASSELCQLKADSHNLNLVQQKLSDLQHRYIQVKQENELLYIALAHTTDMTRSLIKELPLLKMKISQAACSSFTRLSKLTTTIQHLDRNLIEPLLTVSQEMLTQHTKLLSTPGNDGFKINEFLYNSLIYLSERSSSSENADSLHRIDNFFGQVMDVFENSVGFRTNYKEYFVTTGNSATDRCANDRYSSCESTQATATTTASSTYSISQSTTYWDLPHIKEGLFRCLYWLSHFVHFYQTQGYHMSSISHCLRNTISMLYSKIANWYKDTIVPVGSSCLINCQSLAGYYTGTLQSHHAYDFESLTTLLDGMVQDCTAFHVDVKICTQLIQCLIRALCTESLNVMVTVKGYCNWKRGMQIQFNISGLLEWARDTITPCTSTKSATSLSTATTTGPPLLPITDKEQRQTALATFETAMERLLQASKLVQLNADVLHDFDVLVDIASLLSAAQIVRLMSMISCPIGTDLELFLPYQVPQRTVVEFAERFVTSGDALVVQWSGTWEPLDLV